jgi:hypothetical protein
MLAQPFESMDWGRPEEEWDAVEALDARGDVLDGADFRRLGYQLRRMTPPVCSRCQ